MKDFITTIASVLILMMFVMQFAANQASFTKIMGAEYEIRQMRLVSENQGIIKSENIAELKEKISGILECSPSEITVSISDAKMEVKMPVYGVIGPAKVLGIDPTENVRIHTSESMIFLEPEEEPEEEEQ